MINLRFLLNSSLVKIAANNITAIHTGGLIRKSKTFDRKKNILSANMTKLHINTHGMVFETYKSFDK